MSRFFMVHCVDEACKVGNCANLYDTWDTDGGEITEITRTWL